MLLPPLRLLLALSLSFLSSNNGDYPSQRIGTTSTSTTTSRETRRNLQKLYLFLITTIGCMLTQSIILFSPTFPYVYVTLALDPKVQLSVCHPSPFFAFLNRTSAPQPATPTSHYHEDWTGIVTKKSAFFITLSHFQPNFYHFPVPDYSHFLPKYRPCNAFCFSRVHATLWPALSVGRSVGRSVDRLVTLSFFLLFYVIQSNIKLFQDNLHLVF